MDGGRAESCSPLLPPPGVRPQSGPMVGLPLRSPSSLNYHLPLEMRPRPQSLCLDITSGPRGATRLQGRVLGSVARTGEPDGGVPNAEGLSFKPEGFHFSREAPQMWDPTEPSRAPGTSRGWAGGSPPRPEQFLLPLPLGELWHSYTLSFSLSVGEAF